MPETAIRYAIETLGYPEKVIAHATHCTRLTEQGREEIPYPQP